MNWNVFGLKYFLISGQFILWIGLGVSYMKTQEECGNLKILVYYVVVGISGVLGLFSILFCLFLIIYGEKRNEKCCENLGDCCENMLNLGFKVIINR